MSTKTSQKRTKIGRRTALRTTAVFLGLSGSGVVVAETALDVTTCCADESDTSADLIGDLNDLGGADSADVYFEWREAGTSSWNTTDPETLTSTGRFSHGISGLTDETDYEFRSVAEASDGDTDRGDTVTFTTTGDPVVYTEGVDNLDTTSVTLVGSVEDLGGADSIEAYFEWGLPGDLSNTTDSETITDEDLISPSYGFYRHDVTGLEPATTYEFRAVGDASDGDSDTGKIMEFTTEGAPVIDQFDVTDDSNNTWTRVTVDWAVSDPDENLDSVTSELIADGSVVDSVSSDVSGGSASGSHDLEHKGSADSVRLTAVDTDGNETSDTKTL